MGKMNEKSLVMREMELMKEFAIMEVKMEILKIIVNTNDNQLAIRKIKEYLDGRERTDGNTSSQNEHCEGRR